MKPNLKPLALALALAILCIGLSNTAFSADRNWLGSTLVGPLCTNGFHASECWQGGDVPSVTDSAFFNFTPNGSVTFTALVGENGIEEPTSANVTVSGSYNWNMQGRNYDIAGNFTTTAGSTLTITGGGGVGARYPFTDSKGNTRFRTTNMSINGSLNLNSESRLRASALHFNNAAFGNISGRIRSHDIEISNGYTLNSTHVTVGKSLSLNENVNIGSDIGGDISFNGRNNRWFTDTFEMNSSARVNFEADTNSLLKITGALEMARGSRIDASSGGRVEAGSIDMRGTSTNIGPLIESHIGVIGGTSVLPGSVSSLGDATLEHATWTSDQLIVKDGHSLTLRGKTVARANTRLTIESGGTLDATGGASINLNLAVTEGSLLMSNNGTVGRDTSTIDGSVSSRNDTIVTGENSLWIAGDLEVTNFKTLLIEDNAGVIATNLDINTGGHLVINNAAFAAGPTIFSLGSGTINVNDPFFSTSSIELINGTIDANINLNQANLKGTGVINGNVTGTSASIGPGNSPGLLTINGDFSVDSNSDILFELGGLIAESQYDVINVTGTADLAGELVVDLFDLGGGLFDVSEGDFFDILTAETITGSFDLLTLALLDPSLQWELSYLTDFQGSTDILRLSAVSAVPVPAAFWLFGSGLLGLVGVARRKKA